MRGKVIKMELMSNNKQYIGLKISSGKPRLLIAETVLLNVRQKTPRL
jgi:hypothetical protein